MNYESFFLLKLEEKRVNLIFGVKSVLYNRVVILFDSNWSLHTCPPGTLIRREKTRITNCMWYGCGCALPAEPCRNCNARTQDRGFPGASRMLMLQNPTGGRAGFENTRKAA